MAPRSYQDLSQSSNFLKTAQPSPPAPKAAKTLPGKLAFNVDAVAVAIALALAALIRLDVLPRIGW